MLTPTQSSRAACSSSCNDAVDIIDFVDDAGSKLGAEQRGVALRLETDFEGAVLLKNRPLDHRRIAHHQGDGFRLSEVFLVGVRQLMEGGAGAVEHLLPARRAAPLRELRLGDAELLIVVEVVGDAVPVQPGKRLLHRVAVLNAVDGDGHTSLPLNRSWRSRGHVIHHAVDAFDLVDDARHRARK